MLLAVSFLMMRLENENQDTDNILFSLIKIDETKETLHNKLSFRIRT